jgi:ABC-type transport system involved in multi-copper enzyme maturation permease subunit
MRSVVRSELIRIWRPTFLYGGIGVMAAAAGLVSVFIYTSAQNIGPASGPTGGPATGIPTVGQIAEPGGFLTALGPVSGLAGLVLLVVWAMAVANDYSSGLIRILVQAQPRRTKLLAGKLIALVMFTLVATAATTLVVVLISHPLARLEGISVHAWRTDFFAHLFSGYFNFLVAALVWGLIGAMLAELTHSSALAIGIGIGYLLVFESLIGIVAPHASPYLPAGALNALVMGGTIRLAWAGALGLVILYGAVATAVAFLSFRTRDIIS